MKQILTEEIFSAPQWMKIVCYILSIAVLLMGVGLFTVKDLPQEIFFVMPFIFLIAISMLMYTQLQLIISDSGIRFIGGLKSHHFTWEDITMIDMRRLGKYKTPTATIYYSDKKFDLQKGFYLQPKFNRILSLLEMKAAPELFTENYKNIRQQIKQSS
ncbi:hypothetical protein [Chryseobacterium vaccae]|uniref:hypothetical protein n=1 Tax=Chryseobacterium vaccae TaxID=2604424 RepID=UPI001296AD3A|nr:hypothetical protein [Chryseobacterium vaccae]